MLIVHFKLSVRPLHHHQNPLSLLISTVGQSEQRIALPSWSVVVWNHNDRDIYSVKSPRFVPARQRVKCEGMWVQTVFGAPISLVAHTCFTFTHAGPERRKGKWGYTGPMISTVSLALGPVDPKTLYVMQMWRRGTWVRSMWMFSDLCSSRNIRSAHKGGYVKIMAGVWELPNKVWCHISCRFWYMQGKKGEVDGNKI